MQKNRNVWLVVISCVLILGLVGAWGYQTFGQKKPVPKTPKEIMEQKKQELIDTIEQQVNLPKDEQPLFATITNEEQLKKQDFFHAARNGDKILMYPKNKKAFLYRPSTKQVIATTSLTPKNAADHK